MNTYPEYKESGAGWLGEVPSHWKIQKLKHVASIETGTTPSTSKEEYYENGTTLWIKPDDLNGLVPIENTKRKLTELGMNESRPLPPNSVLVCGIGSIGKFGVISDAACFNQQINGVSFYPEKMNHRFGLYLIASMESELKRNAEKVVVSILNKSRQSNIRVPTPPIEEQLEIAQFLDEGILKIDLLITEKQSFINLLEEKRQALISHVVTKGLDDSAEMKDSGVEWIGEVPAHWVVMRMKHVSKLNAGTKKKQLADDEKIEFLPMSNVDEVAGEIRNFDLRKYAEVSSGYTAFQTNDVIFAKITPCMENGNCVLVPELTHGYGFGSTEFIVFRANKKFLPEYLFYVLRNKELRKICETFMTGTAGQQRISTDFLAEFPVAVPSIEEQIQIIEHVRKNNSRLYELKQETKKSIELLKEHRSALISAAVTGKIDVREEV